MLQVMLAGLVLSNTVTLGEATLIFNQLHTKSPPGTVEEVVKEVETILNRRLLHD